MIDTDKYEGHTKGDNWRVVNNFVFNEDDTFRFIGYINIKVGENNFDVEELSDADANLIADAPLILQALIDERAKVKRLQGLIK